MALEFHRLRKAALSVRVDSQQAIGYEDDPFGSPGPPMLVGAYAYFELVRALNDISQEEARAELERTE